MQQSRKYFWASFFFISMMLASSSVIYSVTPYYSIRTQTLALPRIAGITEHINQNDKDDWYGTFNTTFGYTRSFKRNDIVRCLFDKSNLNDDCNCPFLRVSGSRISNRDEKDWLADYFGLPTDFKSEIFFKPRISNFIVDFNAHIGFDHWIEGAYFEVHAPFVHSKWEMCFNENIIRFGDADYDRGYFSTIPNREDDLVDNVTCFMSHHGTPRLNAPSANPSETLTDLSLTVTFNPLCYSRWNNRCTETRFSDIYFILGFNGIQSDDYSLGLYALVGAPAGTRPKGEYLFEPIVGNGHHPELGIGMSAQHHLWHDEESDTDITLHLDGHATHLFKTKQIRSFDLQSNGCNSRYMLAMKLGTPVTNLFANTMLGNQSGSEAPIAQFKNVFTPVANLTAACVDVTASVQGQLTAMFNIHKKNIDFDIGYRFWGRACERIRINSKCPHQLDSQRDVWALKGDAHVYGFLRGSVPTIVGSAANDPVALSGTQSKATIHKGTNNFIALNGDLGGDENNNIRPTGNPFVDNAQFARAVADNSTVNADILDRQVGQAGRQTKTSKEPIFFNTEDINFDGSRTRGISHTLFFDMTYSWFDHGNWFPYIGIGGKVEWVKTNCQPSCDGTGCTSCQQCTPSEWGVWFKGGVSFN